MLDLKKVEDIIGYCFRDKTLLERALTHASYGNEHNLANYQRLEFLGDSILDFAVAEYLFNKYPSYDEGRLTKMRAGVVSKVPLAKVVERSGLISFLVGAKDVASDKVKSDIFESIIASIYLDSGSIDEAKKFVLSYIDDLLECTDECRDYKSKLIEWCVKKKKNCEFIRLTKGNNPDVGFEIALEIDGIVVATKVAKSVKLAEQACAREAFSKLNIKV